MIRYTLRCHEGHAFESWFASADAYDKLAQAGLVECSHCGSAQVEKTLMSPAVRPTDKALSPQKRQEIETKLKALRDEVEKNSTYVGANFATEARAMHEGASPERAIHGEANLAEVKDLIEEGVPVLPLPFLPKRRTN